MQQELFPGKNGPAENNSFPVQVKKGKHAISKEQQSFNRLTARIKSLQEKIKKNTDLLTTLSSRFHERVNPEVKRLGEEKIRLSHLLHEKRKNEKLSAHLNEKLDELIFQLLDDAFSVIEPDEKTKELFAQYNGASYEEEMDMQKDDMAEILSSLFFEQTGIKIDPEELKKENPDFTNLDENIKKQFYTRQKKTNKKTKKQSEKEEAEKRKEEIKQKSLRSIYLSLAKILHPDKVYDENMKQEKEEYMKRVTAAYNNKDLMELLRLEIMWVDSHEASLQNAAPDTLNIFIQLLKDQVKDLEHESIMVVNNPAFSTVSKYVNYSLSSAFSQIEFDRASYIATHTKYSTAAKDLEKGNRNRSIIVKCIEDFYFEEPPAVFPGFVPSDFFDDAFKKKW